MFLKPLMCWGALVKQLKALRKPFNEGSFRCSDLSFAVKDLQGSGFLQISLARGVVWSLCLFCYPFYNKSEH